MGSGPAVEKHKSWLAYAPEHERGLTNFYFHGVGAADKHDKSKQIYCTLYKKNVLIYFFV